MADHKITDFVDQSAIDGLQRLKGEMQSVKDTYIAVAIELIKGLKIPVDGYAQLEQLTKDVAELQRKAAEATQRHSAALDEQNRIVANTTNTISRQLMEQEKLNEKTRSAYTRQKEVKEVLAQAVTSYDEMTKRLATITVMQEKLNESKRSEKKAYEDGNMTEKAYRDSLQEIIKQQQALAVEKSRLEAYTRSEAKENAGSTSSYNALSQELLRLKKAYRELDEEGRGSETGQRMLAEIKELGAHLKDMDASMGDFQRNVGDYAIACRGGVVVTEELNRVLALEAGTVAGCIEQNKALEEAKGKLDMADASYAENLERINQKIADNNRRISDVGVIMTTTATTVGQAEQQNRMLAEAIKLVDVTTDEGKEKIAAYNAKIKQNKELIESATPALQDQQKASQGLADQLLTMAGINPKLGASFQGLAKSAGEGASVMEGLKIKAQALFRTLSTLMANPVMLTLLGIGGVVAGFKWWYDYNKGLIEASRLTQNFAEVSGEAADKVTAKMQTIADKTGKGFRETIEAANALVQQFGVSWDDAYKLMQDGIAAGADMSGNMISNISRFSPALRDAGVSAEEFMSILAATRNGVFDDKGIQNIVKASTRLRAMTKQTQADLEAVGISAQKMQDDLESGNLRMVDAVKQVAQKLQEIPENSQQAGNIMKDVFGRTAAEGGMKLIQSIADINTNLETAKENMGELGRLNEEQTKAQLKLNETLMAVFKSSGTSFEEMTIKAKTFVTNGLVKIIEGCVGVVNWFIRLYNNSIAVRASLNHMIAGFKNIWAVAKAVLRNIIDSFKALGEMISAVLTFKVTDIEGSFGRMSAAYSKFIKAFGRNIEGMMKDIAENAGDAYRETLSGKMKEVSLKLDGDLPQATGGSGTEKQKLPKYTSDADKAKGAKAAEKAMKEELKRIDDLEEAKIKAMKDGHEKEIATITENYMKKIRYITGETEKEKQARIELIRAMIKDLAKCEADFEQSARKVDLSNRLAAAEKGSQLELNIKLVQLEDEREAEVRESEKTGADIEIIDEKYDRRRRELLEEYASKYVQKAQERYATESALADNAYNRQLNDLNKKFAEELKAAGNNTAKREEVQRRHENAVAKLTEDYASERASATVKMYEEILKTENLSEKERIALEDALAKAKIDLEKSVTDAVVAENDRQVDIDTKATEKRIANAQRWLSVASDALNAMNDLAASIYDAEIQRIEDEQEADTEASDAEQERISDLVEKKVITEEEGEARKRAAEAKTAQKQEELEKKKQDLKYKQAVWDKANTIAQIGLSTALAVMNAANTQPFFPLGLAMTIVAGALGAVELATAIATPIPKYAKGTSSHPGGLAIVGDGGKREVMTFGGQAYITPDKPTLVDMPKGAEVYPDADKLIASNADLSAAIAVAGGRHDKAVVVNNDYSDLKREVVNLGDLIRKQTRAQLRSASRAEFERFKIARDL